MVGSGIFFEGISALDLMCMGILANFSKYRYAIFYEKGILSLHVFLALSQLCCLPNLYHCPVQIFTRPWHLNLVIELAFPYMHCI